jgi:alpha-tubulin suppressor-like RCC1 family protein
MRALLALATAAAGCDVVFQLADVEVPGWTSVVAGPQHTCAIRHDGSLWCWGSDDWGELGIGGVSEAARPIQVGAARWRAVTSAGTHTCGLQADGSLWCWGRNNASQLGLANTSTERTPARVDNAIYQVVSAGAAYACAIRDDGSLWCWGNNSSGQLGDGTNTQRPIPTRITSDTWLAIDTGPQAQNNVHTCGIRSDATLWCWGSNEQGQLGDGTRTSSLSPVHVEGGPWAQVSTGERFTCGRTRDGRARCWGSNSRGRLAIDSERSHASSPQPVLVDGADVADWVDLRAGGEHACGVRVDGSLWCWGSAARAQIGAELDEGFTATPRRIEGGGRVWHQVATGRQHTCAIDTERTLWCFGHDGRGQLGTGGGSRLSPVQIAGEWAKVAVGELHTCAIDRAGHAYCAGGNATGEVGDGTTRGRKTFVDLGPGWADIATGAEHTCAITSTSELACWGRAHQHQLGNGETSTRSTPTLVPQAGAWTSVVAANHTCALDGDRVWCWGANGAGQVGSGTAGVQPAPVEVASDVVELVAGMTHTCAGTSAGQILCWGADNAGQLGNGEGEQSSNVPMATVTSASGPLHAPAAGGYQTCALAEDATAWCWGQNRFGQLGTGDTDSRGVPTWIGPTRWRALATAGTTPNNTPPGGHTCGIQADGSLWCWGANSRGQLGLGTLLDRLVPTRVGGDRDWAAVSAGVAATCALKTDGALWCWGDNAQGVVPDGGAWRAEPRPVL